MNLRILVFPLPPWLTHCRLCEPSLNSGMEGRTGGAGPAGVCPGSGLPQAHMDARWRSGLSLVAGETEAVGTGAGQSTSPSSERMTAGCCRCWTCWRPASPGEGRTPAPHSSSSCWTSGPCLCYCRVRVTRWEVRVVMDKDDTNHERAAVVASFWLDTEMKNENVTWLFTKLRQSQRCKFVSTHTRWHNLWKIHIIHVSWNYLTSAQSCRAFLMLVCWEPDLLEGLQLYLRLSS